MSVFHVLILNLHSKQHCLVMLSLLRLAFFAVSEEEEKEMINIDLPVFLWQERCERRFGLCKEYFFLPWTEDVTSPAQRYFSLKRKEQQPEIFALPSDEGGLLAERLRYFQDEYLLQDLRSFFAQRRDKTEKRAEAKRLFQAALYSGREEYVDEMVHQMHIWSYLSPLPETIDKVIKPVPFSPSFSSKDYIEPGRRGEVFEAADLIDSIKGGNVRIVLYIQEHCSLEERNPRFQEELIKAYIYGSEYGSRNPQGFYSILQYLQERYQNLYKLETLNKDHLLLALQSLAVPNQNPKEININQERVLRKNAYKCISIAKAFASYLTLDILNLLKEDRHRKSMREFAQKRLDKGEYLRGPIIYGGDVSNRNLSILPPGLKL
ncbi:hypothetical protein [Cedratvirus kamchatka]|uniref:Uncharacterized protein n=1 Tax=Cedratvirus kamchatka TaxID=2716914 RepID=A0A6G8MY82_9VIRU|nr:hypothetical protein [Cedratvirus kamchatka]